MFLEKISKTGDLLSHEIPTITRKGIFGNAIIDYHAPVNNLRLHAKRLHGTPSYVRVTCSNNKELKNTRSSRSSIRAYM